MLNRKVLDKTALGDRTRRQEQTLREMLRETSCTNRAPTPKTLRKNSSVTQKDHDTASRIERSDPIVFAAGQPSDTILRKSLPTLVTVISRVTGTGGRSTYSNIQYLGKEHLGVSCATIKLAHDTVSTRWKVWKEGDLEYCGAISIHIILYKCKLTYTGIGKEL